MKQGWVQLLLLIGLVSPALAQERPVPAPERTRERTLTVSPEADQIYYFNTNRGKMGITVSILPQTSDSVGALVEAVTPGSPAFKAGIQSGDLIARLNGQSLVTMTKEARRRSPGFALMELAAALSAGDTARLEYRRGTNRRTVSLVLEPEAGMMTGFMSSRIPRSGEAVVTREWRGELNRPNVTVLGEPGGEPSFFLPYKMVADLELAPMNPELGQYFGVTTGVLVISAPDGSGLKLRGGDVVIRIDGRRVSSPNQFFRILRSYGGGEEFRVEIVRMKRPETVTASIGD